MILEHNITADASETIVRERLVAFFAKVGYVQTDAQTRLVFQRGSSLGSLLSFSPKGWKANAVVDIASSPGQPTQVMVTLGVNTTGQLVTERERTFWRNELDELSAAVQTGSTDASSSAKQAQSSLRQNLVVGAVIVGLMIIMAIGGRLMFDSRLAIYVGGAIGFGIGVLAVHRWAKFRVGGS